MKAEYICADQPVNFIFRLRQSGGPYIRFARDSGRIAKSTWRTPHWVADTNMSRRNRYAVRGVRFRSSQ
jgi:hypothetical protein